MRESFLDDTTWLFRLLYRCNLMRDYQKHGQITLLQLFLYVPKVLLKRVLYAYALKGIALEPINKKFLRPMIWRFLGCKVGKNVHIGHLVACDFGNASLITIDDDVVISNRATFLCHKRDTRNYIQGMKSTTLPFVYEGIHLKQGCQIGLNVTIMPGVSVGEGSIIGSCSLVTKDVPDWSIAVGVPAKVVKTLSSCQGDIKEAN